MKNIFFFVLCIIFLVPEINSQDKKFIDSLPKTVFLKYDFLPDTSITSIEVYKNRNTNFKSERNFTIISLTGGLAIIGSYSTFRFKEISNEAYENYKLSGNQTELDKSKTNDLYFYLSLAVTQIALAGLFYMLFFDK